MTRFREVEVATLFWRVRLEKLRLRAVGERHPLDRRLELPEEEGCFEVNCRVDTRGSHRRSFRRALRVGNLAQPGSAVSRVDSLNSPAGNRRPGPEGRVALLLGAGTSSNILFHYLRRRGFHLCAVAQEDRRGALVALKSRIRRCGWRTALGQGLFRTLLVPMLAVEGRKRCRALLEQHALDPSPIPTDAFTRVSSVNSEEAVRAVSLGNPDVVVINGTRILSKKTLARLRVPVLNVHVGLTPEYRGCHGGYWALAQGRRTRFGVTVHLVDEGIDTGRPLRQAALSPSDEDNFTTYPTIQLATGLRLLEDALRSGLRPEEESGQAPELTASPLLYHPTAWYYLAKRLMDGVR